MGIKEKIKTAKTCENWITRGFSETEIKQNRDLGRISAEIELRRHSLKMSQKELGDLLGVNQSMISKYESGEYNFTISTLNDICFKMGLEFTPVIRDPNVFKDNIKVIHGKDNKPFEIIDKTDELEAIA